MQVLMVFFKRRNIKTVHSGELKKICDFEIYNTDVIQFIESIASFKKIFTESLEKKKKTDILINFSM